MNIKEYKVFYHVDISTQIDNKWKNDTALGIVKDSKKYSLIIKGRDKEKIKSRFVSENISRAGKRHNKRVVTIIYCYLLYKALCDFNEAKLLLLCRDVRPERLVINYLRKIVNYFGDYDIFNREIKFRKRNEFGTESKLPKSLAGKYVRKVYQGKILPNKIIDKYEIEELIEIIGKII